MSKFIRFVLEGSVISVNARSVEMLEDYDGETDPVTGRVVRAMGARNSKTKVHLVSGRTIVIPVSREELERLFSEK